jgi:hypothetical protein
LKSANYKPPSKRPLLVYAFDPTLGRKLNNYMTVAVPYEPLRPGPIGLRIAVIDYDASNHCYYEPVDLDHLSVVMNGGLEPSESDPRFHQQMVYAVACETIRRFEFALGRPIKWRSRSGPRTKDPFRQQLRIFPHAFQQPNAFYDPELRALCFGYFQASPDDSGDNLPGQTIFTCLSHDVIAHETTHAIIDSLRCYFTRSSNLDTPAFHEAFADIVALLQHFSMEDAVLDTINRTGGLIYRAELEPEIPPVNGSSSIIPELSEDNPLAGLARQFGQSLGMRSALRSAIGTPPHSRDLEHITEPHLRGAILVAAVFDAYFTIYVKRTRDLMRIARAGGAAPPGAGYLHPDLARRLARQAAKVASHFLTICIRALDYCPPVDITFGEFLRAVITADADALPDDPLGYRAEIIKAFRLRGIIPEDAGSYSEDALRWPSPAALGRSVPPCTGLVYDVVETDAASAPERHARRALRAHSNASVLTRFAKAHSDSLGLLYKPNREPNIQTHSFHPIHRVTPDGRLVVDFVVEFLQRTFERLDPDDPKSPWFEFRGGSTVIFDDRGHVRYAIEKRIDNPRRLNAQREFYLQLCHNLPAGPYKDALRGEPLSFAAIHRGY